MVGSIIEKCKHKWQEFKFFVQDEARFGRITSIGKSWCPYPLRPEVKEQIVREYTYVYSAISPQNGDNISLILPYANSECMEIFLKELAEQFPNSMNIVQLDGASFHTSDKIKVPENISLICQPPYSPQLNPTENFWDHVKENHYRNKCFKSLIALENDLCQVLHKLHNDKKTLMSITSFPWIIDMNLNAT